MFSRLLFGFILLTVNFVSVANTKEQAGDTIPFIIYKVKPINPLSVISTQTVNPQVYLSAQ